MNRTDTFLFSDLFVVGVINEDGNKFDRVCRLKGRSENYDTSLILDYQHEIYPLNTGDRFTLTLIASSDRGSENEDVIDTFEYVCHGRCFSFDEIGNTSVYYNF